jgi:hypothetical protein
MLIRASRTLDEGGMMVALGIICNCLSLFGEMSNELICNGVHALGISVRLAVWHPVEQAPRDINVDGVRALGSPVRSAV